MRGNTAASGLSRILSAHEDSGRGHQFQAVVIDPSSGCTSDSSYQRKDSQGASYPLSPVATRGDLTPLAPEGTRSINFPSHLLPISTPIPMSPLSQLQPRTGAFQDSPGLTVPSELLLSVPSADLAQGSPSYGLIHAPGRSGDKALEQGMTQQVHTPDGAAAVPPGVIAAATAAVMFCSSLPLEALPTSPSIRQKSAHLEPFASPIPSLSLSDEDPIHFASPPSDAIGPHTSHAVYISGHELIAKDIFTEPVSLRAPSMAPGLPEACLWSSAPFHLNLQGDDSPTNNIGTAAQQSLASYSIPPPSQTIPSEEALMSRNSKTLSLSPPLPSKQAASPSEVAQILVFDP